jgi:hypothetical protein
MRIMELKLGLSLERNQPKLEAEMEKKNGRKDDAPKPSVLKQPFRPRKNT